MNHLAVDSRFFSLPNNFWTFGRKQLGPPKPPGLQEAPNKFLAVRWVKISRLSQCPSRFFFQPYVFFFGEKNGCDSNKVDPQADRYKWSEITFLISTWNSKQPILYGCFNWKIQNLYMGNGCFTKHLFINGCLGFQVGL